MLMMESDHVPEKYSRYKTRMVHKKMAKLEGLMNSIDDLSLRPKDKIALKNKLAERAAKYVDKSNGALHGWNL